MWGRRGHLYVGGSLSIVSADRGHAHNSNLAKPETPLPPREPRGQAVLSQSACLPEMSISSQAISRHAPNVRAL
jgi:hypothetical protein